MLGTISPIDPAAQLINFQVNLPTAWNGKALQYGGGGFNGSLVPGLIPLRDPAPDDPPPITRGYVTLDTDSGHQSSAFAASEPYKKVKDVGVGAMRAFYNRSPSRMYYFGGSEGGREGLTMAQRFAADYDGGQFPIPPMAPLSTAALSLRPRSNRLRLPAPGTRPAGCARRRTAASRRWRWGR